MKLTLLCCMIGLAFGATPLRSEDKPTATPTATPEKKETTPMNEPSKKEVAVIKTSEGEMVAEFWPDVAPKTVENFKKLAKAGFYDGLRFDRLVHQEAESPDGMPTEIRMVRFGCPAGTGDPGVGHIGYRLRSEFSDAKHEAGTVGFTRDADPSSAGVRLYISLAPAPILDGSYTIVGKVSRGIDVVEHGVNR